MSDPYLLPEIFDFIIDLLHDNPKALNKCCLVSKSWVRRTRKHLFAEIQIRSTGDLTSWKETFPNPRSSPGYYARTLFIGRSQVVREAGGEEGGWVQAFSRIERLTVSCPDFDPVEISLVPFRTLSPFIKSLQVTSLLLPRSQVFSLIHSLPLLENLTLIGHDHTSAINDDELDAPPTSPALTGTLVLLLYQGMANNARRLLNLPNGLHFRKLNLSWRGEEELRLVERLVEACSDTLEYLEIAYGLDDEPRPGPIDLSRAKKLKDVVFRPGLISEWVITSLGTISSRHRDLQQISIHIPDIWSYAVQEDGVTLERVLEANSDTKWLDLDRLLIQFWESRSIRPKVVCNLTELEKKEGRDWGGHLFPELTRRGIIDLVEYSGGYR